MSTGRSPSCSGSPTGWRRSTRTDAGDAGPEDLELLDGHWDLPDRIPAALAELGLADLDLGARVGTLSGGQAVLTALAGLFLARPDALVLDEPTNNLDRRARGLLTAAVRRWTGPVMVVSHDRELLDVVDQVVEIRAGIGPRPRWEPDQLHRGARRRAGGGGAVRTRCPSRTCGGSSVSWPRLGCGSTGGCATPAARPTTCRRS